jgi:hypothetical protein
MMLGAEFKDVRRGEAAKPHDHGGFEMRQETTHLGAESNGATHFGLDTWAPPGGRISLSASCDVVESTPPGGNGESKI